MPEKALEYPADDETVQQLSEPEYRPPPPQYTQPAEAKEEAKELEELKPDEEETEQEFLDRLKNEQLRKPLVVYLLGDSGFSLALMAARIVRELAKDNTLFDLVSTLLRDGTSVVAAKTYIYTGEFPGPGPLYKLQLDGKLAMYFAADSQADEEIIGANVEHYKNIFVGLRTVLDDITGCRWSSDVQTAPLLKSAAKCILGGSEPVHGAIGNKPYGGSTIIVTAMGGTGASRSVHLLRNMLTNRVVRRATRITLVPIFPPASALLSLRRALEYASRAAESPIGPGANIEFYNEYINMYTYLHIVKSIVKRDCRNDCKLRFMPIEQAPPSSYWALGERTTSSLLKLNPYIDPEQYIKKLGLRRIVESIQAIEVGSADIHPTGQWGLPGRASSFSVASFLALACSLMLQENDVLEIDTALVSCTLISIDKSGAAIRITPGAPLLHETLRGVKPIKSLPVSVPRDASLRVAEKFKFEGRIGLTQLMSQKPFARQGVGVDKDNAVYVFVYDYYRFEDTITKYIEHLENLYNISDDSERKNIFDSFLKIARRSYEKISKEMRKKSDVDSLRPFCTDEYRDLLKYILNGVVDCN